MVIEEEKTEEEGEWGTRLGFSTTERRALWDSRRRSVELLWDSRRRSVELLWDTTGTWVISKA